MFGDGGALLLQQHVGSLSVSVFASPSPLRVGVADFSVLLQNADNDEVLLDGTIELDLSKTGENDLKVNATPGQVTNRLLYAANVQIPQPGDWSLVARCREHGQEAIIRGTLNVLPREQALLTYWLYFAAVPIAILLFVLNQQLKARRRVARLPARPSPHSFRLPQ